MPLQIFEYADVCRAFRMPCCDVRQDTYRHHVHSFCAFRVCLQGYLWVETSVKINYLAIFRYTTNTGHRKKHAYIYIFHTNQMLLKTKWIQGFRRGLCELRVLRRFRIVFKVIVLIVAPTTKSTPGYIYYKHIVCIRTSEIKVRNRLCEGIVVYLIEHFKSASRIPIVPLLNCSLGVSAFTIGKTQVIVRSIYGKCHYFIHRHFFAKQDYIVILFMVVNFM